MRAIVGVIALMLNVLGYIPYIRDIFKGIVKPHRMTWGIWTILTTITAVNQIANHGGYSSLFFISTTVLVTTTFILSLKFGVGGFSKIDLTCLLFATLLLIYWVGLKDTRISTLIAVNIDVIGFLPTLIKTYKHPETETYPQWLLAGIAGLLTTLIVPKLDWAIIIYPAYIFIFNFIIVSIKFLRERKQKESAIS